MYINIQSCHNWICLFESLETEKVFYRFKCTYIHLPFSSSLSVKSALQLLCSFLP